MNNSSIVAICWSKHKMVIHVNKPLKIISFTWNFHQGDKGVFFNAFFFPDNSLKTVGSKAYHIIKLHARVKKNSSGANLRHSSLLPNDLRLRWRSFYMSRSHNADINVYRMDPELVRRHNFDFRFRPQSLRLKPKVGSLLENRNFKSTLLESSRV